MELSVLYDCIPSINCFPLDLVQLYTLLIVSFGWVKIPKLYWQTCKLYFLQCTSAEFAEKEPLEGILRGDLSINIELFSWHSCNLWWMTDTSSELVLWILWGSHSLNKKMALLFLKKGGWGHVWFIFDLAQQKACSKTYLLVHQAAGWNECGPSSRSAHHLFTCASSLCWNRFPHALWPAGSRHLQHCQHSLWGFCSELLDLICKYDKTQSP